MQYDEIAQVWTERLGAPLPEQALALLAALPGDAARVLQDALLPAPLPVTRDRLTGLLSRPVLEEALNHEVVSASRYGAPALLVADLDGLTGWMEAHGHLAGDLMVMRTAELLVQSARRSDVLGRLGVDQLAVVLPRTDLPRALVVARRALARAHADARTSERTRPGSTVALPRLSIGVGHLPAPRSVGQLLEVTEAALQRARQAGGGVVEVSRLEDLTAPVEALRVVGG